MGLVFLSHHRGSSAAADSVERWLRDLGYGDLLFIDRHPTDGLIAGSEWLPQLLQGLRRCRVLVAAATPSWCASHFCFFEALHAHAHGIPVVLLRFPGATINGALQHLQWMDVTEDDGVPPALAASLERLLPQREAFRLAPERAPYPGLRAFEEADAAVFFGRDAEIQDALRRIERMARHGPDEPRLLLLAGPTGSGKSSLLRAGVLARLRRLAGFRVAASGRPGPQLAGAMAAFPREGDGDPGTVPVFAIDQLDDALAGRAGDAGAQVLDALRAMLRGTERVVVISTLRLDLWGELQRRLDPDGGCPMPEILTLAPPGPAALERMIRDPMGQVGGTPIEDGLVRRLLADLAALPTAWSAALPMLAHTLHSLWRDSAPQGGLTLAGYEAGGGLPTFAGTLAERLRWRLPAPEARARIREMLIPGFVAVETDGRPVRRRRLLRELGLAERALAEELVQGGLMAATEDGAVGLAHDVLFDAWPELRDWFEKDRAVLVALARLHVAAGAWQRSAESRRMLAAFPDADYRAIEGIALDPRFVPEFDEGARRFFAACRDARREVDRGAAPLPASVRDTVTSLLQALDRLRSAPGVRLAEVERMMAAVGNMAEEAAPAIGLAQAASLLAEVDVRFAEIHRRFGDAANQRRRAADALNRLARAEVADARRLRFSAHLLLSDAAAAEGVHEQAFRHMADAEGQLEPDNEADAVQLAARRAGFLREIGENHRARRTAQQALARLERSSLAGTREGEVLRASCLRELGAACAGDALLADGVRLGRTCTAEALDILARSVLEGAPGKPERLLRATLLCNRAASRPVGERKLAEPDYRAAVSEVRAILDLDPGEHVARSDLVFYLSSLGELHLGDEPAKALECGGEAFDEALRLAVASPGSMRWHEQLKRAYRVVLAASREAGEAEATRRAALALADLGAEAASGGPGGERRRGYESWLLAGLGAHQAEWTGMAQDIAHRLRSAVEADPDPEIGTLRALVAQFFDLVKD